MNIRVDDDVEVLVLSAALASQGLALVWEDRGPKITKVEPAHKVPCACGKPASVLASGQAFCSTCYLEGTR